MAQREDMGSDGDGREDRRPRNDIIERPDQVLWAERESDLFGSLPHGRGEEVGLRGLLPAAGQGHVPRPGVACPLGATNQQQRIGIGGEDDSDRSPDQRIASVVHHRAMDGEAIAKTVETAGQWLWLWQLPPQHPPAAGGPSRLRSICLPPVAGRAVSDMSRSSFRLWQ